jgi:hypothetical protein
LTRPPSTEDDGRDPMATTERRAIPAPRARSTAQTLQTPLLLAAALVCIGSVAISAAEASSDAAFGRGLLQLLVVGVPIGVAV